METRALRLSRWSWRYLVGLVVVAGVAALLAGGVKAALLPGGQPWWRTMLAEGLAGAVTATVTLLFFDRLREQQAVRARRIHDIPLLAAVASAGQQLIEAWPENDGVPPDGDSKEAADEPGAPQIPPLGVLAELATASKQELLETASELQELRRAGIAVLDTTSSCDELTDDQVMDVLDAVHALEAAHFRVNAHWVLAPARRESRVGNGQVLLESVLSMQAPHDRPEVLEAASAFAQSIQSLRAKNQWAHTLEADLRAGLASQVVPETLPLAAAMTRLTDVAGRAGRSLAHDEDAWAAIRPELGAAVQSFPNLLGFYVSLARTTARAMGRTAKMLAILDE